MPQRQWLRCTNVSEWLMVSASVVTVLNVFHLDWLLGILVGVAEATVYCLGVLNGMRLAREERDGDIDE
jgi:hypothetical protein